MRYISVVILLVFAIFAVSKASPSPAPFFDIIGEKFNELFGKKVVAANNDTLSYTDQIGNEIVDSAILLYNQIKSDAVSETTPKPVEPNAKNSDENSWKFGTFFNNGAQVAKDKINELFGIKDTDENSSGSGFLGKFADFFINAAKVTEDKFNEIKSEAELFFESAKSAIVEGPTDIGKKALQKLMDLAEQTLRFIENKLKDLSDGIDSHIKNQLENIEDELIVSFNVHQRTITEMKSLIKANDTCTQKYDSQIDKLKEAAINRLKECMEEELKSTKSVAIGAKETLIDLPRKIIRLTANILACINRPGFHCVNPIGDLVSAAITLFSVLGSFEGTLTGSIIKPLKTTTCILNAQKIFEDETIALNAKILKCSSRK